MRMSDDPLKIYVNLVKQMANFKWLYNKNLLLCDGHEFFKCLPVLPMLFDELFG